MALRPLTSWLVIAALSGALASCVPSREEKPQPVPAAGGPESAGLISPKPVYNPPGLSPQELKDRMAKGEHVVIVDVRSQAAFDEAHIAGAKSIPWAKLSDGYAQLPKDRLLALYCT